MSDNNKLKFLVGNSKFEREILDPFNEKIINFFSELSKEISRNKEIYKYPDLMAFAFFCRKANLIDRKSVV